VLGRTNERQVAASRDLAGVRGMRPAGAHHRAL